MSTSKLELFLLNQGFQFTKRVATTSSSHCIGFYIWQDC